MSANPTRLVGFFVTVLAAAACTMAVSCSALSQPTPDRAFFAIDPGEPAPFVAPGSVAAPATSTAGRSATMPAGAVLKVHRLRLASPYDGQEFVYRTRSNE